MMVGTIDDIGFFPGLIKFGAEAGNKNTFDVPGFPKSSIYNDQFRRTFREFSQENYDVMIYF